MAYNNVEFRTSSGAAGTTIDLNSGVMTVNGLLTFNGQSASVHNVNNGTILASGDIVSSNYGNYGNALVKVVGSANQSFTGSSNGSVPHFEINKSGGPLTFASTIRFRGSYEYTAGSFSAGTSHLIFYGVTGTTVNMMPGPSSYYDVTFFGSNSAFDLNGGALNVMNTLTLNDTHSAIGDINNGTVNAYGNLIFSGYGKEGTAVLNVLGSNSITVSDSVNARNFGTAWQVNKTGGATITLTTALNLQTAGQSINVTDGDFLMSGFAMTVPGSVTLGGNTITKGGGVLTVGGIAQGTGALLGGTVNP